MKTPRLALAALSLSMLLSSLGTSIANVALPTLADSFGTTFREVQWVVLAYLLALTGSSVSAGSLGDRVGRRRLLLAGLALFTAASIASGVAPGLGILVAARVAQGLGAAVMMALAVAFVGEVVPKERVGSAMGLLGTTSAIGTALGPSLGGVLIDSFGWRAVFLVNVPLGLAAAALVHRGVPRGAAGGPASPYARLALLRDRTLRARLGANLLVSAVMMATLVVGPFYLSRALGLEANLVGLVMSMGPVVAALAGVPAGRLVDRLGARPTALAGLLAIGAGAGVLSAAPESSGVAGYVAPIVAITAGYALFQAANNTAVVRGVGAERRGAVSGTLTLSRNLGLILGASAMGAVFTLASGANDVASAPPAAVAAGMRVTFAVASGLALVALVVVAGARLPLGIAALLPTLLGPGLAMAQELPAGQLVLRSADGTNSVRLLGLLQVQASHGLNDDGPDETAVFVNRARVGLAGSVLSRDLRYLFVTDFGGGGPRLLFLDLDYTVDPDWLTVRVGQFKRPFSRPFIARAHELSVIDRALPVGPKAFGDDADVGVMLHNGTNGQLEYAVGVFGGAGPGAVPEQVHPLIAARVAYGTGGFDAYSESDLAGGPPRLSVAAAGLADLDGDGDGDSSLNGLVDLVFKAYGFALSSALYVGSSQSGPSFTQRRLGALGHYTQVGQVVAEQIEPVVRYAFLLPIGEDKAQHDLTGGVNVFFRGHSLKLQTFATVHVEPREGKDKRDLRLQSQISVAF